MTRSDIYLAAKILLERYGADATAQAAANVDLMLARGDARSAEQWRQVLRAIAEIEAAGGRTKH